MISLLHSVADLALSYLSGNMLQCVSYLLISKFLSYATKEALSSDTPLATNPAKRPRISRGTESREGSRQEDTSQQFSQDQLMTVNITALSASILSAVKQAVVEALAERTQPSSAESQLR